MCRWESTSTLDSVRNHQVDEARAEQLAEARAAQASQKAAEPPKAESSPAPNPQANLLNRAVETAETASEAGSAARQLSDQWSIALQGETETSPAAAPAPISAPAPASAPADPAPASEAAPKPENYGLNARDKELLAQPGIEGIRSRFHAALDKFSDGFDAYQSPNSSESGTISDMEGYEYFRDNFVDPETAQIKYWDEASFASDWVDAESGLSGKELFHLDESILEKQQGDEAAKKLTTVNLGSFTNNEVVKSVRADEVFSVIGRDQRGELLAEGHTTLGKAFVLNDGRMILPDEHETGVYFISSVSVNKLSGGGVIDTGNGGYNIDGLYLDGGNAHIGTARPKGGLFEESGELGC
jgi:hypothetical protein